MLGYRPGTFLCGVRLSPALFLGSIASFYFINALLSSKLLTANLSISYTKSSVDNLIQQKHAYTKTIRFKNKGIA